MTIDLAQALARAEGRARVLRGLVAVLAAACAAVYFLIGFGLIYPASRNFDSDFMLVFGCSAGLAFALGFVLLLATQRRAVLVLGALFQVFVIVAYVAVAPRRDPHFEIWGISLKIAQAAILAALLGLLAGGRTESSLVRLHRPPA